MTLATLSRDEWLKLRKNYIGASDAPVIMNGFHFGRTPYQLWEEKLGFGKETKDNFAMQIGRLREEPARQAYEKLTGNLVAPEMVFHKEKKFMMASLDGLSFNGDIAVEIKNVGQEDHALAKSGKIPEKYYPQLQHQLACIGHEMIHYFSYLNGEGVIVEVGRDHHYLETLYEKEAKFWDNVTGLVAPALTARDYRDMSSEAEWNERAKQFVARQKMLKELEEQHDADKAWFIEQCEDQSSEGAGVRAIRVISKGLVDYKAIPELKGVDLEPYRKKPRESWRVTLCGT